MITVRGTFRNGSAQPLDNVEGREGQPVLITFLEEGEDSGVTDVEAEWEALRQLLEASKVDTGIADLAHEHDHYLHGKPKKGP